jgi:hypothetical protein
LTDDAYLVPKPGNDRTATERVLRYEINTMKTDPDHSALIERATKAYPASAFTRKHREETECVEIARQGI